MVKAVGAQTAGWLYRAALVPGVRLWMTVFLVLHCFVLPEGSVIGGFCRICLEGGRTHCFFPEQIVLVPDGNGGWSIDEEGQASGPGVIEVNFGVRHWNVGLGAPTERSTWRYLQIDDRATMAPVTLPPAAAAAVRAWIVNPARARDFDEALAGRTNAREPIPAGYIQNAVLGAQAVGVAWCVVARAFAKSKDRNERRRRGEGVCVRCAYPVVRTGIAACPECGRPYAPEDLVEHVHVVELGWSEIRGGPFDKESRS